MTAGALVADSQSLDVFTLFGTVHVVTVGACAVVLAAVGLLGGRLRATSAEPHVRHALAIVALAYWFSYYTWWNWYGIDLVIGLPLQTCDVSELVAPLALLTRNRWLRSTLYFWTFAFATQAFIQPTLTVGPAHLVFWAFWLAHTLIAACALYDITALGFRPDWTDLMRALVAALAYAAIVLPVDLWLGANYGFIGNPPAGTPIPAMVEALGPWPQRLIVIFALAGLGFVLALAPWLAVRRGRSALADTAPTDIVEKSSVA
jgi:hypothetical integral membrane protein (TIGR02206 family)